VLILVDRGVLGVARNGHGCAGLPDVQAGGPLRAELVPRVPSAPDEPWTPAWPSRPCPDSMDRLPAASVGSSPRENLAVARLRAVARCLPKRDRLCRC
jgi:hypothetical protein